MQNALNKAPRAQKKPKELVHHGDVRIDDYYWLNDRENPEVIQYLEEENTFRKKAMQHTEKLQEDLFAEIKGRIKEDDSSVPYFKEGYWYYIRFESGGEHPLYCRRKETMDAPEEIMINAHEEAKNHEYYNIGGLSISPDNEWLAYGVDTLGRRIYQIRFRHIATGEEKAETLENCSGGAAWSSDGNYVFYTVKDEALRPYKIFRHKMGTEHQTDSEIFHESDATFICGVGRSKSRKYLVISSHSTVSNEFRFLPTDNPLGEFKIFQERERHLEYSIMHYGEHWYIHTNKDKATNFKLMRCGLQHTGKENWEEVIPHREDTYLEDVEIFKKYLVLEERKQGLTYLRIKDWAGDVDFYLDFSEEAYTVGIGNNPDFDSSFLRYNYSSLTTPTTVYDYYFETGETELRKQQEIIGGHEPGEYETERIWAQAPDGKEVAISLVYKKALRKKEGNPLLLFGYGSYGITVPASFSVSRLSLLDRGFTFAIAHIRGSQYLGRPWYEDGKLLRKKNTFTDFIACAEKLIAESYTTSEMLHAMGGSAGGMLMGTVINMRPELFKAVVAAVPFVDVLTTMLDESIPLTTGEFDEWGNPKDEEYYHYIKSYSPYDNVVKQDYPALLITTGLHDSQVQYWEPAKWCAKLREYKTDTNSLYMYCNMGTGHGGASGRFEALKETAMEYAFILDQAGKGETA